MKRHPAFDPPEYVDWRPDPGLQKRYSDRITQNPERLAILEALSREDLVAIYRDLLLTRLQDIQLKRWVKQGVISKAWLGTGEEAVTVGCVRALDPGQDIVYPMIRNAGACHLMGMPLVDHFRAYLGSADSTSGGRDLHLGHIPTGVIQPISHMGTGVPVAAGVALAFRMRGEPGVALTWVGDGATRSAACHEGATFAAAHRVPAVFVVQDNGVALGTPASAHGAPVDRWPTLYGLPSWRCDGNHVLDVFAATRLATDLCRRGNGPGVVVAETFRMGGHATHDEREARETFDPDLFTTWGARDPVGQYEAYLADAHGLEAEELAEVETEAEAVVSAAAEHALESRENPPDPETALFAGISEGPPLEGLRRRPVFPV